MPLERWARVIHPHVYHAIHYYDNEYFKLITWNVNELARGSKRAHISVGFVDIQTDSLSTAVSYRILRLF